MTDIDPRAQGITNQICMPTSCFGYVNDKIARLITEALADVEAKCERAEEAVTLQLIDERDGAEEALSQAYYLVTGNSPEWSNCFGHGHALEDIGNTVDVLKEAVKQANTKREQAEAETRRTRRELQAIYDYIEAIRPAPGLKSQLGTIWSIAHAALHPAPEPMPTPTPCRVPESTQVPPDESLPITELVNATREEAERQGSWAYSFGMSFDANPYQYPSDEYRAWSDGWAIAEAKAATPETTQPTSTVCVGHKDCDKGNWLAGAPVTVRFESNGLRKGGEK